MEVFKRSILKYQLRDALWYWVYIPAAVIGGGMLIDLAAGLHRYGGNTAVRATAAVLIIVGLVFIYRSTSDLEKIGHGTPNPKSPPKRLVTGGSYSLCRHPMFLGYDLSALGILFLIGSPGALFVTYPAMIFLETLFLKREEQKLERRFGDEFLEYRRETPFLIPFTIKATGSGRPKEMH